MVYDVQVWTIPGGEESCELELVESREFGDQQAAMVYAWEKLEEGYAAMMFRR